MNDKINIPKNAEYVIKTLEGAGFSAFVVGGCVRDILMNKTPKDWDIATSALPLEVKALFKKTFDTGIEHGTVTVLVGGCAYEVTTFRIDGLYFDGRHPSGVTFSDKIEADLLRRDFTMNAIAYNENTGFVDPYGGMIDIHNKLIKGVGDAKTRFEEDALRMLRAVRFRCQLDFTIDTQTQIAINDCAKLIENVSIERVRDEIVKMFLSEFVWNMGLIYKSQLTKFVNKDIHIYFEANFETVVEHIKLCEKNIAYILTLFFMNLKTDEQLQDILKFLKLDNKTQKAVCLLAKWLFVDLQNDVYSVRKVLSLIGFENFASVIYLKQIVARNDSLTVLKLQEIFALSVEIAKDGDCLTLSALRLNGNDLKHLGITNGKDIGFTLAFMLEEVLKNPQLNDEQTLILLAKQFLNKLD